MNIKEKLALLKKTVDRVNQRHAVASPAVKNKTKPMEFPGFITKETSAGPAYYRDTVFPVNHRHGNVFIREAVDVPGIILCFLGQDPELESVCLKDAVFIDTETTGLAGGTGTVAFLVGAGFFREGSFVVRQYFMPDYHQEAPMLEHLKGLMDGHFSLVTFNGKTLDMPIINTRMIMNRLRCDRNELPHLDLLHPARRLWKATYGSCNLTALERQVLGFRRYDDIPGSEIPEIYFRYIRNRRFDMMEKVLEHNLHDIVSMAALAVRMWEHVEMGQCFNLEEAGDYQSLGRIHQNRGEWMKAASYYEKALKCPGGDNLDMVRRNLSLIYKKEKQWDRALDLWMEMDRKARVSIFASVELAKYYEHQVRDYPMALRHSLRAMDMLKNRKKIAGAGNDHREFQELSRRLDRLRKKLGS